MLTDVLELHAVGGQARRLRTGSRSASRARPARDRLPRCRIAVRTIASPSCGLRHALEHDVRLRLDAPAPRHACGVRRRLERREPPGARPRRAAALRRRTGTGRGPWRRRHVPARMRLEALGGGQQRRARLPDGLVRRSPGAGRPAPVAAVRPPAAAAAHTATRLTPTTISAARDAFMAALALVPNCSTSAARAPRSACAMIRRALLRRRLLTPDLRLSPACRRRHPGPLRVVAPAGQAAGRHRRPAR